MADYDASKTYAVSGEELHGIAEAIRLKRDITDGIPVADMAMQVGLISGGGGASVLFETVSNGELNAYKLTELINANGVKPKFQKSLIIITQKNSTQSGGSYTLIGNVINNNSGLLPDLDYYAVGSIAPPPLDAGPNVSQGGSIRLNSNKLFYCNKNSTSTTYYGGAGTIVTMVEIPV